MSKIEELVAYDVIPANDCMDAGGTSPWKDEGRTMQEQLSRATHDCMDAGGRVTHGAVTEEAKADAGIHVGAE